MRPRVTIARLLALIVSCGVAFASLHSPSQMWASTVFLAAFAAQPVALLNAVYARGRERAYWVGFFACGSTYFAASLGPWFRDEWGPRMATTALLDIAYARIAPRATPDARELELLIAEAELVEAHRAVADFAALNVPPKPAGPPSRWEAWTKPDRSDGVGYQVGQFALASTAPFRRIGHALLSLVFACLGGLYARRRQATRCAETAAA